jgi:hypothetical protein
MQYQLMFMTPRPEGFTLDNEAPRGDPSEDAYAFLRQTCAEAIATGRLRRDLTDPDQLAQMTWGSMHGIVALRIVKGQDAWISWRDLRETARAACQTMVRGMLANPPT